MLLINLLNKFRSKSSKCFFVYDSNRLYFKVKITGTKIDIYKYNSANNYPSLLHTFYNHIKVFVKPDLNIGSNIGLITNFNHLFIHLDDHNYLYVGNKIYVFRPKDRIVKYTMSVSQNVAYPYAIGKKYTYLLLNEVYIKNDELKIEIDVDHNDITDNPYKQYFCSQNYKFADYSFHKYDIKLIHK